MAFKVKESKQGKAGKLRNQAVGIFHDALSKLGQANELLEKQASENEERIHKLQLEQEQLEDDNVDIMEETKSNNDLMLKLREFTG